MKTYILQKDLPDVKAGAEGFVNEAGLLCFYEDDKKGTPEYFFPKETYENNESWFKEKKEEKPRAKLTKDFIYRYTTFINDFEFVVNGKTISISAERIGEILIAESKGELKVKVGNYEHDLWCIADLVSRTWFYGNMKVETANERVIYGLLEKLGLYPTTEEDILRRPDYPELVSKYSYQWPIQQPKLYTEKELLEAEEKAFNASRETGEHKRQFNSPLTYNVYPTFQDYKNKK